MASITRLQGKLRAVVIMLVILLPMTIVSPTYALKPSAATWSRTYGLGDATSIQETSEGGFIVAGLGAGARLLKLNPEGKPMWERDYLPDRYASAEAHSIQQTLDGGYMVGGIALGYHTGYDGWLLKLDHGGIVEWSRTYGGPGDDMFSSGQQTLDGGYIFAGSSISSASQIYAWLVKLNSTGGIQWQHKYAEPGWTEADSVRQTSDGGFIVAGKAPINDVTTAWVFKTDPTGNTVWQKAYAITEDNHAYEIRETPDGGFILIGDAYAQAPNGVFLSSKAIFLRLDANGNLLWEKSFEGGRFSRPFSVRDTSDGGFIIAGRSIPQPDGTGISGPWLIRLDAQGNVLWAKIYAGLNDFLLGVQEVNRRGGFVAAGTLATSCCSFWVLRLDDEGNTKGCSLNVLTDALFKTDVVNVTDTRLLGLEVNLVSHATPIRVKTLQVTVQSQCSLPTKKLTPLYTKEG